MSARGLLVACALLICGAAHASACFVSSMALSFGPYNEFATAPTDSVGNVTVTCNGAAGEAVAYSIALSAGGSGTCAARHMRPNHGYGRLNYNLYTTAARALVWGDNTGGSVTVNDAYTLGATQVTRNYPVYGRIFARQKARVGLYTDTIVVTLSF